ncbi:hypothetical protein ABPG74_021931 [Tetrahymena malaccensis]
MLEINQTNNNFNYIKQSKRVSYKFRFEVEESWIRQLLQNYTLWRIHSFIDAQLGLAERKKLVICELINPQFDMLYSHILQQKILFRMMNDQVLILKLSSFSKQFINSYYDQLFQFIDHISQRLIVFEFNYHLDVDLFPHFMKLIKKMNNLQFLTLILKKDQLNYEEIYQSIKNLQQIIYLDIQLPQDNTLLSQKNNLFIGLLIDCLSNNLKYLNLQLPKRNQFSQIGLQNIFRNIRKINNLTHLSLLLKGTTSYYSEMWNIENPYQKKFDRSLSQHLNISLLKILSDSLSNSNLVHLELDLSFQSQYLIQAFNQQTYECIIDVIQSFFSSISKNNNLKYLSLILKEWSNIFMSENIFEMLFNPLQNLQYLQTLILDLSKVEIPQRVQYSFYQKISNFKLLRQFDLIACSDPHFISNESVYLFRNYKFISDYLTTKKIILLLFKQLCSSNSQYQRILRRKEIALELIFTYLIDFNMIFNKDYQLFKSNQQITFCINLQEIISFILS